MNMGPMTKEEELILSELREGKEDAKAQFVRSLLPEIYPLCIRLAQNSVEAEGLCQEVFLRAIRGVHNFKGQTSLSTWLHRVAIHTWKNKVRPSQKLEGGEFHEEILQALNQLNRDDKTLILLRDIEQKSVEEISNILELNLGTVKSKISRAREALRQIIHK